MADVESELDNLYAARGAMEVLFVGLCNALRQHGLTDVVVEAFDYADNVATMAALKLGEADRSAQSIKTGQIIENLRMGVIPDHNKLKR